MQELQVVQIHGKPQLVQQLLQGGILHLDEALHRLHGFGGGVFHLQGFRLFQRGFPCFHSVDDVVLDGLHVLLGQLAIQGIHLGAADGGALALALQLNALGGGVGSLVKLTGQRLHGKHHAGIAQVSRSGNKIQLRFGEYGGAGIVKQGFVDVFHIVTVENADIFQLLNAQEGAAVAEQSCCLGGEAGLLFHKYAVYHFLFSLPISWMLAGHAAQCRSGDRRFQTEPHR